MNAKTVTVVSVLLGAAALHAQQSGQQPGEPSQQPGQQPTQQPGQQPERQPGQQMGQQGQDKEAQLPQAALTAKVERQAVDRILATWPESSRTAATAVMEKYGQPNEATASMLVWHKNGPWKRTVVHGYEVPHHFPQPHADVLEQTIDYKVPVDRFDELARYDGSVVAKRTGGELTAKCGTEEMNILALNVAHEVATGKRAVEDARRHFTQTASAFQAGTSSPYVDSLMFQPQQNTRDMDRPMAGDPQRGAQQPPAAKLR